MKRIELFVTVVLSLGVACGSARATDLELSWVGSGQTFSATDNVPLTAKVTNVSGSSLTFDFGEGAYTSDPTIYAQYVAAYPPGIVFFPPGTLHAARHR